VLGATVERGTVALRVDRPLIAAPIGRRGSMVADRTRAVIRMCAVGAFAVEEGRRVVVDAADGAPDGVVEVWLRGLVAAFVLAQRGRFALHANLVEVGGTAVAVAGPRGAGKTTTSLKLAQRGARVLGDDVLGLASEDGHVAYRTTGRPLRIEPDAAAALDVDVTGAEASDATHKLLLPRPATAPGRLGGIVVLASAPVPAVEHERLAGRRAVAAVHSNLYRVRQLARVWPAECFAWAAAAAAHVPVHSVRRPDGRWTAAEVAEAVESVAAEWTGG
jgi:hypothetical protein